MEFQERLDVLREALQHSDLGALSVNNTIDDILSGTWPINLSNSDPITAAIVLAVMNETNEDVSDIISELEYTRSMLSHVTRNL